MRTAFLAALAALVVLAAAAAGADAAAPPSQGRIAFSPLTRTAKRMGR